MALQTTCWLCRRRSGCGADLRLRIWRLLS